MVSVFQAIEMNMTDEDMIDDEYGSAADEILEFESAIANVCLWRVGNPGVRVCHR